jgi:16S rRNA G527 N7-methylase RsmG
MHLALSGGEGECTLTETVKKLRFLEKVRNLLQLTDYQVFEKTCASCVS